MGQTLLSFQTLISCSRCDVGSAEGAEDSVGWVAGAEGDSIVAGALDDDDDEASAFEEEDFRFLLEGTCCLLL